MSNPSWTSDELILGLDLYFKLHTSELAASHDEIVSLSEFLNTLPIHPPLSRDARFRNPVGVSMELRTFLQHDPRYAGKGLRSGSRLGAQVWKEFATDLPRLRKTANAIRMCASELRDLNISTIVQVDDMEECFAEGAILNTLHRRRERKSVIVSRKKEAVLSQTGALACEVCDFDFFAHYGELGRGFIECHHLLPLCELALPRNTRLDDLAVVCSNCHRMFHRARSGSSIGELRELTAQGHFSTPGIEVDLE